ncbi:hypothetical protein TNCV_1838971 [Trichonephila clavipes]|nr:hypothetical protein TNCV_1838971 [Trichonephila clavipes]
MFVADRLESCIRAVAHRVSGSRKTICRVLNEDILDSFPFQRLQALNPADYLLLNFCVWVAQKCALQPDFIVHVLFTKEATFIRVGGIHGIFERVCQSLHRHCQACIATAGHICEQLL